MNDDDKDNSNDNNDAMMTEEKELPPSPVSTIATAKDNEWRGQQC